MNMPPRDRAGNMPLPEHRRLSLPARIWYNGRHERPRLFATYDRQTKDAYLLGGDINWNNRKVVRDGAVPGLMLTGEEAAWLRACWNSAVGKQSA
jgi:hypothetical protein